MSVLLCHQALALATARHAGLSDPDALRLEQHVASCPRCAEELPLLGRIVDIGRSDPSASDGAIARRALGRALSGQEPRARSAPRPSWRIAVPVAIAAAASALLVAGLGAGVIELGPSGRHAETSGEPPAARGHAHATAPTRVSVAHGVLDLEAGTQVSWSEAVVVLHEGRLRVAVDPRPHLPFRVETARFAVHVTGTRFEVTPQAVEVAEGSVEVRTLEGALLAGLHAGQRWELLPEATADVETTALAPAPGDEHREAASLERVAVAAAAPHEERAPSRAAATDRGDDTAAAEPPPARERFARAATLEASSPDEAATLYESLEREGGPWGTNALFARASLALTRGRRTEARTLLERYLALHPDGPNAPDARALLDDE